MSKRRWGDNDHHFGPFLFARDRNYKHLALVISSGDGENEGCHVRFSCYGFTVIVDLPQIVKPYKEKVKARWDTATTERLGHDWYWDIDDREFGFSYHEGFLQFKYGRQTHDSSTDKSKGYFLPWTQWRFVRHSMYDLDGNHFWTAPTHKSGEPYDFDAMRAAEDACPAASFSFCDYDGEKLTAKTRVEEREWKFGEGHFKWLSIFRRSKVHRSLNIEFSGETGRRKGSWKGGTIGTSIEMLPGETHQNAYRRYCDKNDMIFVGRV